MAVIAPMCDVNDGCGRRIVFASGRGASSDARIEPTSRKTEL